MKVLVISDIHSNIWALETILQKEKDYDLLCCAGDLVDYGTAPDKVVEWAIAQQKAIFVQGNHDTHTVDTWEKRNYTQLEPKDYKWVHYNCERLNKSHIQFLNNLLNHKTFEADGIIYLMQHQYDNQYGIIQSSYQFNLYWEQHMKQFDGDFMKGKKRCLIFGHSHRQGCYMLEDNMMWLNPGSISYRRPDDPDKTAHYAVITDGLISLKRIPYDAKPLLQEAQRLHREKKMMVTELQDFFFFFGTAKTTRDPLL